MVGATEQDGAQTQADSEKVDKQNTLGGTPKHPGDSMMQVIVTNILDPLFEIPGLPPQHPEYSNVSHVKDEYPENQKWGKD